MENRAQTYRQLGEEYDVSREKRLMSEATLEGGETDSNFANYETPAIEENDTLMEENKMEENKKMKEADERK